MARNWLLITVSAPGGRSSTLRVYAWRNLRSLGAHYLQQSVCLLPATAKTRRAATRVVARLRTEGGQGEVLRIAITDTRQEAALVDGFQRERTDEYRELIETTAQFHEELAHESAGEAGPRTPSSRNPTPTSPACSDGSPPSRPATTSTRPAPSTPMRP